MTSETSGLTELFAFRGVKCCGDLETRLRIPLNLFVLSRCSDQAADLSEVLSSRNNRDTLQSHLQRASADMLDVAEMDFVFSPDEEVPKTVRKLLRVEKVLQDLKQSGRNFLASLQDGPIIDGYTFNFPDVRGIIFSRTYVKNIKFCALS